MSLEHMLRDEEESLLFLIGEDRTMIGNERAKRMVREAFQSSDAQTFGAYVMILLDRGYATNLGARGGISFKFIGVGAAITGDARQKIAAQFAPHFGKEKGNVECPQK